MPMRDFSRASVARSRSVGATVPSKSRRLFIGFSTPLGSSLAIPVPQFAPLPLLSLGIGLPWPYRLRWSSSVVGLLNVRRCGVLSLAMLNAAVLAVSAFGDFTGALCACCAPAQCHLAPKLVPSSVFCKCRLPA
jgi:hypothetical protein